MTWTRIPRTTRRIRTSTTTADILSRLVADPVVSQRFAFYDWCARADIPVATNRMVKDAVRIAFGFRKPAHHR
jgi:hypothetical protein